MNRSQQIQQLAQFLAPMLHGAGAVGHDPPPEQQQLRNDTGDRSQPDTAFAVRLELHRLVLKDRDLLKPPAGHSELDVPEIENRLRRVLAKSDGHSFDVLWALIAGPDGKPHPEVLRLAPLTEKQVLRHALIRVPGSLWKHSWVQRKVAGLCMNVIIAGALAIAWRLAWPPPERHSAGQVALALFSIWCLSFVPGWMYIRFLGQRAGALWDEYVLNLHRLAWDAPGRLPEPPVTSQFYAEWFNDGGVLCGQRQNIYRQKFDAYYGRSVSESSHIKGSPVRVETLFPIFLLTATLTVAWTAVLWNPAFAESPKGVWDVLKFSFLGAYTFILQMLVRRFFQSDLRPSAYAHSMLRIVVVLITVAALYQVLPHDNPRTECAAAFIVGFFPLVGMQALQRAAAASMRTVVPSLNQPYPLNQIDGLTIWYEARLLEVGIEDMQSLATANFVDVILHTRVPVGRLVDWVDQAHLFLQLDRIEHGRLERWFAARRQHDSSGKSGQSQGDSSPGAATEGSHPELSVDDSATSASGAGTPARRDSIVRGSADDTNRAGTRTRTALRQLGVRKATDLLKAFPDERVDPYIEIQKNSPTMAHLLALEQDGLKTAQLRSIVRVLSHDKYLAPVWNWELRGVRRVRCN